MSEIRPGKAVGLGVVALVLMVVMVMLGLWQLNVYGARRHADSAATLTRPVVPLDSVLRPDEAFSSEAASRPVEATGHYLAAEQLYVRRLPGVGARLAVVTPLLTSNGSAILVVRGGRDSPGSTPPSGLVHVVGVLEPSDGSGAGLSAGRVSAGLDVASLINEMPHDLYGGYLMLRSSEPPSGVGLTPARPPLPSASAWTGLRNLAYGLQWWVFAVFVAFMWWRMVREPPESEGDDDGSVGQRSTANDKAVEPLR